MDGSPDFENRWRQHDLTDATHATKRLNHPTFGILDLVCDVLQVPVEDQHVALLSAPPGTETARMITALVAEV